MKGSPPVVLNGKAIVGKAMTSAARERLYKVIEKKVWRGLIKAIGERRGEKRQAIEKSKEKWYFIFSVSWGEEGWWHLTKNRKVSWNFPSCQMIVTRKGAYPLPQLSRTTPQSVGCTPLLFLHQFHPGTAPPALEGYLLWLMGVNRQASVFRCWLVGDDRHDPRLPCRGVNSKGWNVESPLIYQLLFCNAYLSFQM